MTGNSDDIAQLIALESDDGVLQDYDRTILQGEAYAKYAKIIQTGKKQGETLFHHVFSGVLLLETLRPRLGLSEIETRILYTAFTIHDLNKVTQEQKAFNRIATPEGVAGEIRNLGLEAFFPDWEIYLHDIATLVRGHGAHSDAAGERLIPIFGTRYGLGQARVDALVNLMRAADVAGLSHNLDERKHKADFLSHLNLYLTASGRDEQYELHTHRIVEQRGLLTNLIHNVLIEAVRGLGWLPVLFYSDGVVYLAARGSTPEDWPAQLETLGLQVSNQIKKLTLGKAADLIEQSAQGIKFRPDALTSGHSFDALFAEAHNLISKRKFNRETLETKARERVTAALERLSQRDPAAAETLAAAVANRPHLIQGSDEQMRAAELARTYFIFLNDYAPQINRPWTHIYSLLDLPEGQYAFYDAFDARYDRPYVLADHIPLSEEEVYLRLVEDGEQVWQQIISGSSADEDALLWSDYIRRYVIIDQQPLDTIQVTWPDHLIHYIENQHQQCVHCSSPYPTQLWRTADVRDGIEVQKFSNRLAGGGNREPVKSVCRVCRAQFMAEAANYTPVKGENLFYLHLFPRTFQTQAFVNAIRQGFKRVQQDQAVELKALHMDLEAVLAELREEAQPLRPHFSRTTKQGKAHPYGIYVPKFSESMAGLLVLPLNAPGDNDSERYLFALWYALILGRYFDAKVILTTDPSPPLTADHLPDLFLDLAPLGSAGLLQYNAYDAAASDGRGSLSSLWEAAKHLFALRRLLSPAEDKMPELVRAMSSSPLHLFHQADRILESKDRSFFARDAKPHLESLAILIGGERMTQLSQAMQQLAAHAWANGLRGSSLKRNSLLYPVSTLLSQLALRRSEHDLDFVIAATCQEIFEHLERIQEGDYKIGRGKREAIEQFVRGWYEMILYGSYGGSVQRMLNDQKLLMSAYLFYIQAEIPRKSQDQKESQ